MKTKRKKTKSGGDYSMFLPFMNQNQINFNLWNKKNQKLTKPIIQNYIIQILTIYYICQAFLCHGQKE